MRKNDAGQIVFGENDLSKIKARLRVERGLPPESVQRRRFEQTLFDEVERLKKKYSAAAQQEQEGESRE